MSLRSLLAEANFSEALVERVVERAEGLDDLVAASSEQLDKVVGAADGNGIKALEEARFKAWVRELQVARQNGEEGGGVSSPPPPVVAMPPLPAPLPTAASAAADGTAAAGTANGQSSAPALALAVSSSLAGTAMMSPVDIYGTNLAAATPLQLQAALPVMASSSGMPSATGERAPSFRVAQPRRADLSSFANVSYMTQLPPNVSAFAAALPQTLSFPHFQAYAPGQAYSAYIPTNFASSNMMVRGGDEARCDGPQAAAQAFASQMPRQVLPDTVHLVSQQLQRRSGRWSDEEHEQFLKLMKQYGRSWTKIAHVMKTRTEPQVRSHAQKYFLRLRRNEKAAAVDDGREPALEDVDEDDDDEDEVRIVASRPSSHAHAAQGEPPALLVDGTRRRPSGQEGQAGRRVARGARVAAPRVHQHRPDGGARCRRDRRSPASPTTQLTSLPAKPPAADIRMSAFHPAYSVDQTGKQPTGMQAITV